EPRLVLFRYQPGSESTEQREQGFLDVVKERQARGAKARVIDDKTYAQDTVQKAQREARGLLNNHPDGIDGLLAVNESAAHGMLNALREKELAGKVVLVGFDSSAPLLDALRKGDVAALVVQDPYRMGYLGLWYAVMDLEGYDTSRGERDVWTGEYLLTAQN